MLARTMQALGLEVPTDPSVASASLPMEQTTALKLPLIFAVIYFLRMKIMLLNYLLEIEQF